MLIQNCILFLCPQTGANKTIKKQKSNPIRVAFFVKNEEKIYLLGFIKSTFLYLSFILTKVLSASMRVLKLPTHTL